MRVTVTMLGGSGVKWRLPGEVWEAERGLGYWEREGGGEGMKVIYCFF